MLMYLYWYETVLDFWMKLENLVPLLGAKLILTKITRENYGSTAGFETVPFQLKIFTLGRINIYWLCIYKPLYLYLLVTLETIKPQSQSCFIFLSNVKSSLQAWSLMMSSEWIDKT